MLTRDYYHMKLQEEILKKLRYHVLGEDSTDDTFYDLAILKAFDRLPFKRKKVLRYHILQLNRKNKKDWTLAEIGKKLGITKTRVQQIESISLRTIRGTVMDCKYYYELGCKNKKEENPL